MRKTVIGAAAAATVALTGLAFAQDQQPGQEKQKPEAGQMERGKASATGKEDAQTQTQTGEERQGQGGKMGSNAQERGNEGSAPGQRQGEAQRKETQIPERANRPGQQAGPWRRPGADRAGHQRP